MQRLLIGVIGAIGVAALTAAVRPSTVTRTFDRTTLDSVYTSAQATRGDSIYRATCVKCHGDKLQGTEADGSPLAGKDFLTNWSGQTLDQLYDKIYTTMPSDKPKSLAASDVADVMALILSKNDMPAGSVRLSEISDSLKTIKLTAR